jgi:hypothetical protein
MAYRLECVIYADIVIIVVVYEMQCKRQHIFMIYFTILQFVKVLSGK